MSKQNMRRSYMPFFFAVVLVGYVSTAAICSIYTMLSTMYRVYDDPLRIGWTVSAYFLISAAASALCGRLGDLLGRRRTVLIALGISTAGALVSELSGSLGGVIAGCAMLGMAGTLMPLAMGIVRGALPAEKVPLAIGVLAAVGQAGSGLAFLAAGVTIDHFSIGGGFLMLFLLGAVCTLSVLAFVPADAEHTNSLAGINMLGGILFAPAIGGIFIAVELGRHWGWGNARTLGLLVICLAVLAGWARHQSMEAKPLINIRSLATRQVALANLIMIVTCLGAMEFGQIVPLFLQQPVWTETGFGFSATSAGTTLLVLNAIAVAGSPWSGHLAARHGGRHAALLGSAVILVSWLAMALHHQTFWFFIVCMVVAQLGISIILPAIYNLIVEATPHEQTSEATGLNYVFLSTFLAVGSQIIFLLLATSTVTDASHGSGSYPADAAYTLSFWFVVAMSLLAMLITWALPQRGGKLAAA